MALIGKGIFGNVSGKIGDVQGSRWKGRDTLQGYNSRVNILVTSKMEKQRSAFANCRNVLSLSRSSLMFMAIGSGSSRLPAWPLWVMKSAKSFPPGVDWSGFNPLVTFSRKLKTPDPYHFGWNNTPPSVSFIVDIHNTMPYGDVKLYYFVYSITKRKIIKGLSTSLSYIPFIQFELDSSEVYGNRFIVFTFFADPSKPGQAGVSSSLVINDFA